MRRLLYRTSTLSREPLEGRAIADEPEVAERIEEAPLPVSAPRRLMIPDRIERSVRAGRDGAGDEAVRVVAKHFHARRRRTGARGRVPAVLRGLADEERRAANLEAGHRSHAPEQRGPE